MRNTDMARIDLSDLDQYNAIFSSLYWFILNEKKL